MVEPEEGSGKSPPPPGFPSSFQDDLAFLVLFSEALLDLVPDGVGVLDDRLRVRAANPAFARALGCSTVQAITGVDLSDRALFRAPVPELEGRPLGEVLLGLFERDDILVLEGLQVSPEEGEARLWAVRAAGWDTEDPRFRRILLWVRERAAEESPEGRGAGSEEREERLLALETWTEMLFDRLPLGLCVLDPAFQVRAANRYLQDTLGRRFDPRDSGDHHLFAVFPELRHPALLEWLEHCRDSADPTHGTISVQRPGGESRELDVEIGAVADPHRRVRELLLLFHEVPPMSTTSEARSEAASHVPCGLDEILAPENLERWPVPSRERILLVEADPWTRMLLSDSLREAGLDDLTLAESGADALTGHDPAAFGAVVVGIEGDEQDAREFCRRVTRDHPRVPLLAVAEQPADEIPAGISGLGLFGILAGASCKEHLPAALAGLFRRSGREEPGGEAEGGDVTARKTCEVILLGARDSDAAVLRLLYRVPRIRIRMVYDPDPEAFGLSLAQNLGIPSISGELKMRLEHPPDAVVLAREGLEEHLSALDLGNTPQVTRDELELFLADPESFLEVESAAPPSEGSPSPPPECAASPGPSPEEEVPDPPAPADPADSSQAPGETRSNPPAGDPPPPTLGARALEPAPDEKLPPPAPEAEPGPALSGGLGVSPGGATAAEGPAEESAGREFEALLGALDLVLDFDRFATHVLDLALEMTGGVSGSLMLLREDGRELRIVAARGLSETVLQKTRQRVGEGIAGRVAEDGEPLFLQGTIGDERFRTARERPEIPSSLCVPVIANGRVLGVLNINSDPRRESFGKRQLQIAARLGREVGSALDRSQQLRRMRGRSFGLSVRAEIEALASTQDDAVTRLRRITGRVVQMLHVDTCSIYILDPKRHELALRAASGVTTRTMDAVSVPMGAGIVGWVARNLRPLVLRSFPDREGETEESAVTSVGVPIRYYTDLIGVLMVESTSAVRRDEDRLELVSSVAAVIGQLLGELHAHEDSERKLTRISALGELGLAFGAAREPGSLARLVAFSACTVLESDVSTMRLLREGASPGSREAEHFELLAVHGATVAGPGDPLEDLEERVARQVLTTGLPCRDTDLPWAEARILLERSNVASVLAVPVTAEDDVLGIIAVYRVVDAKSRAAPFRDDDAEIAVRLADYAAAAAERFSTGRTGGGPGTGSTGGE